MKNFYEKESQCEITFSQLGPIYHLWTQEDFEIIFTDDNDFKAGMNIVGLCAKLSPSLRIITFELMSNHVHFTINGEEENVISYFTILKKHLIKYFNKSGRHIAWDRLQEKHRKIETLNEARNVIVYNNRNGFVVNDDFTPFSYPWGANRFYFNPELATLALLNSTDMPFLMRRLYYCSHMADKIPHIPYNNGYILPISFCSIECGEKLFTSASNYFHRLCKNVEGMKEIAKEIGESIHYTDDEIYSIMCTLCRDKYGCSKSGQLTANQKLELAKTLRYDYNATQKQITRMLRLSAPTLASLGIN